MFRVFVTGTDTGVGKTEVSCALLELLADAGLNPAAFKPYESGCTDLRHPSDGVALRTAADAEDSLRQIVPHRFRAAVAPGVAAARTGRQPSFAQTRAAFSAFRGRPLVAEGAGGLHVPIDSRRDIIDLISALKLPVLLVARAELGTINHTGLSLAALRARRLHVLAVVLTKTRPVRDASERDNARWISERHQVRVLGPVPFIEDVVRRRASFRRALRSLVFPSVK